MALSVSREIIIGRWIQALQGDPTVLKRGSGDSSAPFELLSTLDAKMGIWDRVESHFADLAAALVALAVHTVLDPLNGRFDRLQSNFIALHQAQRKLLLIVVAADIRHVNG